MSRFFQFESRTTLRGRLVMTSALSVGSRLSLESTGTDLPVVRGPDGLPFIPGSSLKGAVRTLAERALRSLGRERDGLWACDPLDPDGHCTAKLIRESRNPNEPEARFSERAWQQSCLACRLFGSPLFAGRLAFKDAFLSNAAELPVVTQVRDGVGIDRDLGAARTGIKYDFEVVVPGAAFDLELLAENVEPWEIGFLLAVLRFWEEGALPIGGKVTRGPGWGRLTDLRLQRLERANLLQYLTGAQLPTVAAEDFRAAFRQRLNRGEERGDA